MISERVLEKNYVYKNGCQINSAFHCAKQSEHRSNTLRRCQSEGQRKTPSGERALRKIPEVHTYNSIIEDLEEGFAETRPIAETAWRAFHRFADNPSRTPIGCDFVGVLRGLTHNRRRPSNSTSHSTPTSSGRGTRTVIVCLEFVEQRFTHKSGESQPVAVEAMMVSYETRRHRSGQESIDGKRKTRHSRLGRERTDVVERRQPTLQRLCDGNQNVSESLAIYYRIAWVL